MMRCYYVIRLSLDAANSHARVSPPLVLFVAFAFKVVDAICKFEGMIIQEEDDLLKSKDPLVTAPVLRYPERAAGRRRRPLSPLPDYETSQALALNDLNNDSLITFNKPPPKRRFIDSRSWRAGIAALAIYIILSIVIGIPLIIKVSMPIACVD